MKRLVLLIVAVTSWSSALSCSCGSRSLEQQYDGAAIVFRAWLVSAERPDSSISYGATKHLDPADFLVGRFEVIEIYKGDPESLEFVYSRDNGGACGVPFETGAEYVFFAAEDGFISMCAGSFRHSHIALSESRFRRLVEEIRALD
jgi:hypothetical protein